MCDEIYQRNRDQRMNKFNSLIPDDKEALCQCCFKHNDDNKCSTEKVDSFKEKLEAM